ncbi:MAG: primosomal protein N' [Bacteroidales bacterium]|nr:primosomal protein N' [Bacteroidales bacterium]
MPSTARILPSDSALTYVSVLLPLKLSFTPSYSIDSQVYTAVERGTRVRVRFSGRLYTGVVLAKGVTPDTDPSKILPVLGVETLEKISSEELSLWEFVSSYYMCSMGEVYKGAYPSLKVDAELTGERIRKRAEERLEKTREMLSKARKDSTREKYSSIIAQLEKELGKDNSVGLSREPGISVPEAGFTLSKAQKEADSRIEESFKRRKPVLLHGVTGSGKTEIYITRAIEALRSGKNVLYLVPEIAMGYQIEERLRSVFGDLLVTFHSGETIAHKRETATRIRNGRYVVLGTRSSIFLPFSNLGLVIVDEEHDSSYKQESPAPRYGTRDTAVMLARIHSCPILLGSATPSLDSLENAFSGKYSLVTLNERYYQGMPSDIEVIDTIAERKKNGMIGSFSRKLIQRIDSTLKAGGQAVILRSRRAYSPIVQCSECGKIRMCPHCNVSLSYHAADNSLKCHYCGYHEPYTGKCPACGGSLVAVGSGTQKIEEEAATLFPGARIARIDGDTTRSASAMDKVLGEFNRGETDILVGTQIITKGFDFAGVDTVAVIQADALLGAQDYRADEKALQTLEQFRGRCGRRSRPGHFLIQTSQSEHPLYGEMTGRPSSDQPLLQRMLEERKAFGYPPFSRIINIVVRDPSESRLVTLSPFLAKDIAGSLGTRAILFPDSATGPRVIGPYVPSVDKVADKFIRIIRVMLPKDRLLQERKDSIVRAVSFFESHRKYSGHIHIDVDPAQ